MAALLRAHGGATLVELQAALEKQTGLRLRTQRLRRVVNCLSFRLKKLLHARERDTEENRR